MTKPRPTVYVVDDDPLVRKSLAHLLRVEGFDVTGFESPREFLADCRIDSSAGCLVLDIQMPELNGLALQEALSARDNELPIIFLTGHGDIPTSVRAMKRGAVDFLTKPVEADELIAAVRRAIEQDEMNRRDRGEVSELRSRVQTLTPREHEVLTYVIGGESNKRIAAELGTVEKTIKVHRSRAMKKMKARSVAELVRLCERAGVAAHPTIR